MIPDGYDLPDTTGQYALPSQPPFPGPDEATLSGKLSGKTVTSVAQPDEGRHIPEGDNGYEGRPLQARKTKRVLATLSAIATGVASVLFIMPIVASCGAGILGGICATGGLIAGPKGMFLGSVIGCSIGAFIGLTVTAYFIPCWVAKVYNEVLEATNGHGFERSSLADRIVAHYEGEVPTSRKA
ncbi:hypothetical protein J7438_19760 [Thalassotalea sp. G20_0]|uniref:hypothetical protein n=1 Tax=Thalassotalea sp. G20_0 TaxID=2821093 RepID=UPI001ADC527C|nr:hypothetical protein [Thalassotalea sp. G20_0]MBO9496295.1 hypothetical protein [Thalassotalea sp. G20_0]